MTKCGFDGIPLAHSIGMVGGVKTEGLGIICWTSYVAEGQKLPDFPEGKMKAPLFT